MISVVSACISLLSISKLIALRRLRFDFVRCLCVSVCVSVCVLPDGAVFQWVALKQQAQAIYITEALRQRNLTLWEAFTAFDYDNNGVLAPSEFYGALRWLKVPNLTAEDVVDFIEAADKNRDGMVDYSEYMDFLSPYEEKNLAEGSEEDSQ